MPNTLRFFPLLVLFSILFGCASEPPHLATGPAADVATYRQINLVSNNPEFNARFTEPLMQNAWGLAIRPAGAGGHFWVTAQATGTSIQYVGDVGGRELFQDALKIVRLKEGRRASTPTGVVFNPAQNFVIVQPSPQGTFRSESKFIFATDSGRLYGWAEKKNPDGSMNRPEDAVLKVDRSRRGDQYFGLALDSKGERLFVADFGRHPQMRVFDASFRELQSKGFRNPFTQKTFARGGEYGPYNVQVFNVDGKDRVFVAYAIIKAAKGARPGALIAGEERKGEGLGRVVEYDVDGNLLRVWNDKGLLNAPWGLAWAPKTGFGKYSGHLLVANFGDGSITAFDPVTFEARGSLLDEHGDKVTIEGLWGILFGNGASLGEANHLYFAAGPNAETDGLFGKIVPAEPGQKGQP